MEIKKRNTLLIIAIIFFVAGVTLVSFAFFYDINYIGQRTNTINSCNFDIDFDENSPITLLSEIPIKESEVESYEPYNFSVTTKNNNCSNLKYVISFSDVCDTCTKTNDICTVGSETYNCSEPYKLDPRLISYQIKDKDGNITSGTGINNLDKVVNITGMQTDTYELKAWIDKSASMKDVYVYENGVIKTDSNGKYIPKNYGFKLNIKLINSSYAQKKTLKDVLLGENNKNVVTEGDGLYKEEYTPSSELSFIYQNNLNNGKLTTYYYKGENVNNYVNFAGGIWQVIRINEDGSIRLILSDGIDSNTKYNFNSNYGDYTYMYYSNSDVENGIKKTIDNWYNSNLLSYAKYIEESTFCEEAKVKYYSSYTSGNAEMTLYTSYTPSFDCKTDGNGKGILSLNTGLVTIDEYLKSGGIFQSSGTLNSYLTPSSSSNSYWTMSPGGINAFQGIRAVVWNIQNNYSSSSFVSGTYIIRPVISLRSDVLVSSSSDGTIDNSYKILTD